MSTNLLGCMPLKTMSTTPPKKKRGGFAVGVPLKPPKPGTNSQIWRRYTIRGLEQLSIRCFPLKTARPFRLMTTVRRRVQPFAEGSFVQAAMLTGARACRASPKGFSIHRQGKVSRRSNMQQNRPRAGFHHTSKKGKSKEDLFAVTQSCVLMFVGVDGRNQASLPVRHLICSTCLRKP